MFYVVIQVKLHLKYEYTLYKESILYCVLETLQERRHKQDLQCANKGMDIVNNCPGI